MKKVSFLFLLFLSSFTLKGQPVTISIDIPDSIFSSVNTLFYRIGYSISKDTKVYRNHRYSSLEMEISSNQWVPIFTSINNTYTCSFGPPPSMQTVSGNLYLSILPFLVKDDSLFHRFQNEPQAVSFRYHLSAKVNGLVENYYSNIDTTYLPKLTPDEILAINYLRTSSFDVEDLVELHSIDNYKNYYKYQYLVDSFPNTIIADMAKISKLYSDVLDKSESIDTGYRIPPNLRAIAEANCAELMRSKCVMVQRESADFLQFIREQQ